MNPPISSAPNFSAALTSKQLYVRPDFGLILGQCDRLDVHHDRKLTNGTSTAYGTFFWRIKRHHYMFQSKSQTNRYFAEYVHPFPSGNRIIRQARPSSLLSRRAGLYFAVSDGCCSGNASSLRTIDLFFQDNLFFSALTLDMTFNIRLAPVYLYTAFDVYIPVVPNFGWVSSTSTTFSFLLPICFLSILSWIFDVIRTEFSSLHPTFGATATKPSALPVSRAGRLVSYDNL